MLYPARSAIIVLCLFACSCSMPMTVRHIENPEQSAEGVRYLLKRPSYELVLVVHRKDLKEVASNGCIGPKTFDAVLKQELSGEPELYEVGGPDLIGAIANVFADTNLTVTLDDSGQLVSVEAGAADKSLEFVQAVAGLAVSLAKEAVGPAPGVRETALDCFIDDKTGIEEYANRHLALLGRRDIVRRTIEESFAALPNAAPTNREKILEAIALLRTEQTQVQAALNEIGYAVPPNLYCLFFDDDPERQGETPKSEMIRINPESGGRAVDACGPTVPFKITLHRRA
jgi:hypothetical protein